MVFFCFISDWSYLDSSQKKEFTSFFLKISFFQTFFFVAISLLRGYFCKIVCYGQQAELNFHLLKSTKVDLLKCLLFLRSSNTASTSCGRWLRYLRLSGDRSFSRSLSLIFLRRWFTCTILSDRLLWHRHLNGQALQLHALYLDMVCTKPLSVTRFASESLSILCPIGQYMPSVSSL